MEKELVRNQVFFLLSNKFVRRMMCQESCCNWVIFLNHYLLSLFIIFKNYFLFLYRALLCCFGLFFYFKFYFIILYNIWKNNIKRIIIRLLNYGLFMTCKMFLIIWDSRSFKIALIFFNFGNHIFNSFLCWRCG